CESQNGSEEVKKKTCRFRDARGITADSEGEVSGRKVQREGRGNPRAETERKPRANGPMGEIEKIRQSNANAKSCKEEIAKKRNGLRTQKVCESQGRCQRRRNNKTHENSHRALQAGHS